MISITLQTYINFDTLVELLTVISKLHADTALSIDLQFLPAYLPNSNLIERLWKCTKKQCLYNRYYEYFTQFKAAIDDCLDKVNPTFKGQVKSLLSPKIQLFTKSANVTA